MSALRYLTAGESHGPALLGILEGIPAGLALAEEDLQVELRRRKLGHGRGARQKIETDEVRIVSGVRHGATLGSPVGLVIENRDHARWSEIMSVAPVADPSPRAVHVPRPGHADRVGGVKYGRDDLRDVLERASARETAMRVAVGTVARAFLAALGVTIASRVTRIGEVVDETPLAADAAGVRERADASPVRCSDPAATARMIAAIDAARTAGDTLGGIFEVVATGLPVGLGSYAQWDRRLDGRVAAAFVALNAIKGVELGLGFRAAGLPGSAVHDAYLPGENGSRTRYASNRAGGIEAGMTTGQPVIVRAVMKPIATLMKPLPSVDLRTGEATAAHIERSDVCAVPAAAVIGEALLALVLADAVLETFGGDTLDEVAARANVRAEAARVR